jgi:hypothetical protein
MVGFSEGITGFEKSGGRRNYLMKLASERQIQE